MTKNAWYIVLGVVLLGLLGAWWYLRQGSNSPVSPIGAAMQTGDTVKSSVPDAVGKTNPFQTDVNPVSGYQNPFGE